MNLYLRYLFPSQLTGPVANKYLLVYARRWFVMVIMLTLPHTLVTEAGYSADALNFVMIGGCSVGWFFLITWIFNRMELDK